MAKTKQNTQKETRGKAPVKKDELKRSAAARRGNEANNVQLFEKVQIRREIPGAKAIITKKAWSTMLKKLTKREDGLELSKLYNFDSLTISVNQIARRVPSGRWSVIGSLYGWEMDDTPDPESIVPTDWLDISVGPGGENFDPIQFLLLLATFADLRPRVAELPPMLQKISKPTIGLLEGEDLEGYNAVEEEVGNVVVLPILPYDFRQYCDVPGSMTNFVKSLITDEMKKTSIAALEKAYAMDKKLVAPKFQGFSNQDEWELASLTKAAEQALKNGLAGKDLSPVLKILGEEFNKPGICMSDLLKDDNILGQKLRKLEGVLQEFENDGEDEASS